MTKLNKKTWIIIASVLVVAALVIAAIIIIPGLNDEKDKVTVSFNSMGGEAIEPMQVDRGTDLRALELPQAQKEGVVFNTWYSDEALTTEFYDTDGIINENTTLYAGYTEYEEKEAYLNVYEVGETTINISPDGSIELLSFVELTSDNLYDHITVLNQLEISEGDAPALSVTKTDRENIYKLSPIGQWPEGGMFVLEASDDIKFVLRPDEKFFQKDGSAVSASRITLLIDITKEIKNVTEFDSLVNIEHGDLSKFTEDEVVINASAVSKYNVAEGMILKVELSDGSHQYIKAGKCQAASNGDLVIVSEAALPGEVYSEFEISGTAEDTFSIDDLSEEDKQNLLSSLTSNPNFVILENLAALSATDYVNEKGIANVTAVKLLSGETVGDPSNAELLADVGNLNFIWETVDGPDVLALEDEYKLLRTGVSFDVIYDDDTYARITLEVQTGSSYGLLVRGHSKKLIPISDVWLNARLKADFVTVFKFNIIMHDGDNVYDASEEMNNFGSKDSASLVAQYKELINLDTEKLKILDEDLYEIPFNILDIIVLRVPFGLEVEIDLNGSFSTELINRVAHFYGVNGSVLNDFEFWDAHCWQMQYEKTSYYGKFDASIGVRSGLTLGLAGMDKLGRVGLKAEIGVYYQFLGYGYTSSSYESRNAALGGSDEALKKDNKSSTYTSTTNGAMYHEFGLYLQFGIYVESEIFGAKAEAESPQIRIKLVERGTVYKVNGKNTPLLPLGFSKESQNAAKTALVVDEYGLQMAGMPYFEVEFLNLKTGELITMPLELSDFEIRTVNAIGYDRSTGRLVARKNASRVDTYILLRYVDDALYYIDGYSVRYSVQEGNKTVIKQKGAYAELKIPITYLPSSLSGNMDKLDDVFKVDFKLEGTTVKSLDVKYGATIYTTLREKNVYLHDYVMSGNQALLNDPNISLIRVPDALYHTPVTENLQIELEVDYYGVPITVKRITGIREQDGYIYRESKVGYMVWCKSNLYDELSELAVDPHENMRFAGWRDLATGEMISKDRIVDISDSKTLVVEAVYESTPITVTVNIEPLNDGTSIFDGAVYTYEIKAGEGIFEKCIADFGARFMIGSWAMYIPEYEKYADSFNVKFFENETVSISWCEMPAEYKVTFDPNGGHFTMIGEQDLKDGVYIIDCAHGFTFTSETQDMLVPEREDDTATYRFLGWYYLTEDGEKMFGLSGAEEDRTYYAEWLKEEKYFDLTLNASGSFGDTVVEGTFTDGKSTRVISLKYSELKELAEKIKSGSYESIEIFTPTAGMYVFDRWVLTSEENGNYIFTAEYAPGMVSVTILSKGPCGDGTAEGSFPEGTVTSLTLTPSEWEAMRARIDAFDYTELPVITPVSDAHIFSGWRVSTYSELEYNIIPIFTENKEITITISAVGDHNGTAVPGTLSGADKIVLRETEATAFLNKVYNADYSEMPTVTPNSDEYIFSRWQVSYTSATECLITPVYGRGAFATVTYELGRGSNANGIIGTKTYTFEIIGETLDFSIQDSMQPTPAFSVNGYNENGLFTDYACFEDEHYYYVFKGWRTSDGKTSWSLKHNDFVTITAEYEKLPKAYSIELTVDFSSAEKEIFIENGRPASYGLITLWGAYGTKWSEYEIPTAVKQTSDDSPYTYKFVKWVDVNTGQELPEYVADGDRYKAVFEQITKPAVQDSVKVTFDAGEDGYFLSTGERYKTVEYAYGTLYDDVVESLEEPIRNNAVYQFHDFVEWWYGESLTEDMTVTCVYWNAERGCLEGEEDLIQVWFDAGEGAYFEANYNDAGLLVYPERDPRYFVHAWEENTLFYSGDDPADNGYTAGRTHDIGYFDQFVIVKDGQRYTAKWDITAPFIYTWDVDKLIITYTELIPVTE